MLHLLILILFLFSNNALAAFSQAAVDDIQRRLVVDKEEYQKIFDAAKKHVVAEQNYEKIAEDINKQVAEDREKYQATVDVAKENAKAYQEQAKKVVEKIEENITSLPEEKPQSQNVVSEILAKYQQLKSTATYSKTKDGLYIFVSFSMPQSLLETLDKTARQIGARLVIRGLKNNSFKETLSYIKEIKKEGIMIDINPVLFEDFAVNLVPAFVVVEGKQYDKIVGNVSIPYVLEQFANSGDTKASSSQIMKRLLK
jgi:conjugal transfer pilus assembly protein TrbC